MLPDQPSPSAPLRSDRRVLLEILGRVRRRLRLRASFQGAVRGGGFGLGACAVPLAAVKLGLGGVPLSALLERNPAVLLMGALGGAAIGAGLAALRSIPLASAARIVDAAQGPGAADRTLSALDLSGRPSGPFAEALLCDALLRARRLPLAVAAPLGRPRGLRGLAAASAVVAALAILPTRQRPARASGPKPPAPKPVADLKLELAALEAEREEVEAARRSARENADEELARLSEELARTLAEMGGDGLPRAEALDRLAALERKADDAAQELDRLHKGLEAAGRALEGNPASRQAGEALRKEDDRAAADALKELAAKAASQKQAERTDLARTLAEAAEGARNASERPEGPSGAESAESLASAASAEASKSKAQSEQSEEQAQERRLARDKKPPQSPADAAARAAKRDRRLERLSDDLDEASDACRRDPEACRRQLNQAAENLPKMEHEATKLEARRRLASALRQLRERIRRGGPSGGTPQRMLERRFERLAQGGEGSDGQGEMFSEEPGGDDETLSEGGLGRLPGGQEGTEGSQGQSGEAIASARDTTGGPPGQGIGSEPGGAPLGQRTDLRSRGREQELKLKSGAGPSRAEVIESAARRGFSQQGYRRVFQDYAAVLEETLDATAVPAGKRYLVRRYFQLIRPRAGSPR